MGLLSGPTTKTTSSEKFDTGPSAFQKPYLDSAFGAAQDIYNSKAGTPYYQGDLYAGMTPEQKASYDAMSAYAGGAGMQAGQAISNIGNSMITAAGDKAITNLDRFTTMAGEDATASNIEAANRYADNPYVSGMIDANSRDISRNLYENEIPGIDRAASSSGNINSSRAGVASGIAQRGAADRIGDISAQIRGNAYDRGLTLAQTDRSTKLDAYGRAAEGYSKMTGQGIDAVGRGTQMGYDALGHKMDVQDRFQQDKQGELDAAFAKWQGEDTRDFDLLNNYYNIIGGNQWGQSGTSTSKGTSTQSGGMFGQLLGAAAGLGSAAIMHSDPRLKSNIVLIGTLPDGLNVYVYTYRQDLSDEFGLNLPVGFQIGVMADEVAALRPHALGPVDDGGFASVNYAAL